MSRFAQGPVPRGGHFEPALFALSFPYLTGSSYIGHPLPFRL